MILDVRTTPYVSRYCVLLDGVEQRLAIRADDEAGTVVTKKRDEVGLWCEETHHGKVEIIPPPETPPIVPLRLLPGDHLRRYVAAPTADGDAEFVWMIGGKLVALRGSPDHLRQFATTILHQLGVT